MAGITIDGLVSGLQTVTLLQSLWRQSEHYHPDGEHQRRVSKQNFSSSRLSLKLLL